MCCDYIYTFLTFTVHACITVTGAVINLGLICICERYIHCRYSLSFYILLIYFCLVSVLFISHDVPLCVQLLICCHVNTDEESIKSYLKPSKGQFIKLYLILNSRDRLVNKSKVDEKEMYSPNICGFQLFKREDFLLFFQSSGSYLSYYLKCFATDIYKFVKDV